MPMYACDEFRRWTPNSILCTTLYCIRRNNKLRTDQINYVHYDLQGQGADLRAASIRLPENERVVMTTHRLPMHGYGNLHGYGPGG